MRCLLYRYSILYNYSSGSHLDNLETFCYYRDNMTLLFYVKVETDYQNNGGRP